MRSVLFTFEPRGTLTNGLSCVVSTCFQLLLYRLEPGCTRIEDDSPEKRRGTLADKYPLGTMDRESRLIYSLESPNARGGRQALGRTSPFVASACPPSAMASWEMASWVRRVVRRITKKNKERLTRFLHHMALRRPAAERELLCSDTIPLPLLT